MRACVNTRARHAIAARVHALVSRPSPSRLGDAAHRIVVARDVGVVILPGRAGKHFETSAFFAGAQLAIRAREKGRALNQRSLGIAQRDARARSSSSRRATPSGVAYVRDQFERALIFGQAFPRRARVAAQQSTRDVNARAASKKHNTKIKRKKRIT